MSVQRTLEQQRAEQAWKDVRAVKENNRKPKEYLALARRALADIQSHGLAQTLAFWRAKGEPHHLALYEHVSRWVMQHVGGTQDDDLLAWITNPNTESTRYRQAAVEALAFLEWIKRFAEAELK